MVGKGARLRVGWFLALLILSLVRVELSALRTGALTGVEKPVPLALPTARSWWRGAFQPRFERWFARQLPGREHLVRTDNQVSLTLFRQAPSSGTPTVLGREGTLIEKVYLDKYNYPMTLPDARISAVARDLRRLDELLARRGVNLILIIAPSKAEVYPETLPPRSVLPNRERKTTVYELLVPQLEAAGISFIDGHRLFIEERKRSDTLLFARGGTHWNHYGTALIAERLLAVLEQRSPGRFVQLKVKGSRVDSTVWSSDDDLGLLLNVWWPRPWTGPQTHPVAERLSEGRVQPRLVFVGDSFSLNCLDYLTGEGLMESGECLYYFKRRILYPGGTSAPLEQKSFDILKEIEGLDAVVLVVSEINLWQTGFGFVKTAIAGLEAAQAPPRSSLRSPR